MKVTSNHTDGKTTLKSKGGNFRIVYGKQLLS